MEYSEYVIRVQGPTEPLHIQTFEAPSFREAIAIWQDLKDSDWDRFRALGAKYMILAGKGAHDGKAYPLRSVSVSKG